MAGQREHATELTPANDPYAHSAFSPP
jgi:hypothetical protein